MTEGWTKLVADVADWFPGGLYGLALVLLLIGTAIGLAGQPAGLFRRRRRRRERKPALVLPEVLTDSVADEELPELPAQQLLDRAQRFMAVGDYRMAVREWLRVMVRELVEYQIVENSPGWTVTELARAAGAALPPAAAGLDEAARIFSDVWYGGRDADLDRAARMRDLRGAVTSSAAAASGMIPVEAP